MAWGRKIKVLSTQFVFDGAAMQGPPTSNRHAKMQGPVVLRKKTLHRKSSRKQVSHLAPVQGAVKGTTQTH
eukprot:CAMPEP_0203869454 /NCGR_PEP_ID=MMETSP0359-20131031/17717_1 /ASSEMBLY_ACC=CAM_ASM_000338 /TAXON_ID=268821 /ORGANISM="Scrippsiella Hangoei, Strain SHTV-5" /LENGTH=70 /DNA_ID=CAMNT_0050788067 /DNA_START=38 /DNA_END=247 /DNA_ORIENTATION=+